MRRLQAEIIEVAKHKEKAEWHVRLKSCGTGRELYMDTTRSGYCKGQTVKLTCEKVSEDGEVVNPRFGGWVPFLFRKFKDPERQRVALTDYLVKFRKGCHLRKSSGRVYLEGGYSVAVDKRGWFVVYRGAKRQRRSCHAKDMVKWIVAQSD